MRKTTLFAAILMLCIYAGTTKTNAQAPGWLWATNAGYNSYDEAYAVAIDAHGNSWVAGYYNTYIFNLPLSQGPDAFMATFDPDGNLTWTGGISDTGAERITNIAFDGFGNYYLLGLFDGNKLDLCDDHFTNSNPSAYDIFIAKYDSLHNCLWARHAGGTDQDTPTGLAVDSLGNCYITGYFNSTAITFGAYQLTNSGGSNSDLFVAKYDADGTALWAKSATGTVGGIEISKSIAIDKQGNCYITGNFNSATMTFDAIVINKVSNFNMCCAKYSATGTALWAFAADGSGDTYGYSVAVDPQSNCYVTGSFRNSLHIGDTTFTSAGGRDIFVAKYTPDSSVLWAKSAGGTLDDEPSALAIDHLGYCYLTGFFKSPSLSIGSWPLTNNSNSGFSDIFHTEFEPNGSVVWAKSIGGIANDNPNALAPDLLRNVVIGASLGSTSIAVGDTTLYSAGTVDALIVKSGNVPTSGIISTDNRPQIVVYPNPAGDVIWVTITENSVIEIINMQGQVRRVITTEAGNARIDIGGLRSGVYFITIRSNDNAGTVKFIKM